MRNPIININTDVNFCGIRQRDILGACINHVDKCGRGEGVAQMTTTTLNNNY